jgi:Domain of unknown function (DUF4382)
MYNICIILKKSRMKNLQKSSSWLSLIIIGLIILIAACQKQIDEVASNSNSKKLSIYLTDDPCNFDSLFVDIRYVEVKIDTSKRHRDDDQHGDDDDDGDDDHHHHDSFGFWDTLSINAGVYNILKLRNGLDTLLASGNIPAGKIRKIRITLGTNNAIVVSGIRKPLTLLAGTNSYVYVKIHKADEDDDIQSQSAIWLDFDVCKSIKQIGGQYYLKPFLKTFSNKKTGRVEGKVFPRAATAFVQIFNAADSGFAIPENDGKYKIRGLKTGVYKIKFYGHNGYFDTTISNITVQRNKETDVQTITLHN